MALFLLRKIEKNRWIRPEYLPQDETRADTLLDLQTKGNRLSLWLVEEDRSNLERIVAALAAQRDHMSNLDYALIDCGVFEKLNIKVENSEGTSPDSEANKNWHRELVELSVSQVAKLAKIVEDSERERVSESTVARWIGQRIDNGHIERELLKPGIAKKAVVPT